VAYKLELVEGARCNIAFHVGLLKPYRGVPPTRLGALPPIKHGRECPQPVENIKGQLAHGVQELLVH
jgi:hypothetical protein